MGVCACSHSVRPASDAVCAKSPGVAIKQPGYNHPSTTALATIILSVFPSVMAVWLRSSDSLQSGPWHGLKRKSARLDVPSASSCCPRERTVPFYLG